MKKLFAAILLLLNACGGAPGDVPLTTAKMTEGDAAPASEASSQGDAGAPDTGPSSSPGDDAGDAGSAHPAIACLLNGDTVPITCPPSTLPSGQFVAWPLTLEHLCSADGGAGDASCAPGTPCGVGEYLYRGGGYVPVIDQGVGHCIVIP